MSKRASKNQVKERNKRKRERKRTILLLLLLFLSGIFGTVIYAWFSSNMKLNIDTMDIRIETMAGIQVSANAINWSNSISKDDIINAVKTYPRATNQLPETLGGCSTDGSVSGTGMNMYYGITNERRNQGFFLTAEKQTEINCVGDLECQGKHYIAFDVFILLNEPAELVITGESFVNNKNTPSGGEDGRVREGGENSVRVGFVNMGTTTETVNSQQAQYLFNASSSVIWEPNYDTHTEFGIENAENVYHITTTATGAPRLPYKGINSAITGRGVLITETNNDPHFSTVNPQVTTIKGFNTDQNLTSYPKGVTKIRIYFWLEGQDVDMENEASGGELEFKLELSIKE